jgi:predicted PurR-regulated permease PerM
MIMSKVIGLQPPVIIVSLLIGAKLAGIGGAALAPPVLILLKIIFSEFLKEEEKLDESLQEE